MSCVVVCLALGVDDCLEGVPARPYISVGTEFTWKVLAKYSLHTGIRSRLGQHLAYQGVIN